LSPLRIAILLDDSRVPLWVKDSLDSLAKDKSVNLALVIINKGVVKKKNNFITFPYRILRFIDKSLIKKARDPFARLSLDLLDSVILEVKPIQTRYSDRFPDDAISRIKEEKIDIILRFGFRILRGDILSVAKWGLLSLHHGCTKKYRGGPPAFWEVINKEPVTTVTLQKLTEQLDGGIIIGESHLRTNFLSFYMNQVNLYWAGKELLLESIKKIIKQGPEQYFTQLLIDNYSSFYSEKLYKNPGFFLSCKLLISWFFHHLKSKWNSLFFINQWQLIISENNGHENVLYRHKKIIPAKDRIWADPFLIIKNNVYYLFFEEKKFSSSIGHISCLTLNERGTMLSSPQVVLKEDFHLSYPFVFSYNGQDFMIPESAQSRNLFLYVSIGFPNKWQKHKMLIAGIKIYDATLHFHNGYWYLFCNAKEDDSQSSDAYLYIYYSRNFLEEDFIPHSMNPQYRDVRCSRPAGKIFEKNGRLIRPAQIGTPHYGSGIILHEIKELTPTSFVEVEIEKIFPHWDEKNRALHTLNRLGNLIVGDIQVRRFRWF